MENNAFAFARAAKIDSVKIGKRVEDRIHFIAMDVAVIRDLFVWIGIHDLGCAAVVTEERHIGHGGNHVRDESCRGDGDASALRAACHGDA